MGEGSLFLRCELDIWMSYLEGTAIGGHLAHDKIECVGFEAVANPVDSLEPHEVKCAAHIAELSCESHVTTVGDGLHVGDGTTKDDIVFFGVYLAYTAHDGAVDISEREVVEQVFIGEDA